ncbi:hypothetical protein N185_16335 [Sinorhizobium sp. GW3]|nr:hypothetical protein N185_16335 [Sinorhizobium sp. GW3]
MVIVGGAPEIPGPTILDKMNHMNLPAAASSLMGTYFGMLDHVSEWLSEVALPQEEARVCRPAVFQPRADCPGRRTSLSGLRHEFSTRGGLNEHVF